MPARLELVGVTPTSRFAPLSITCLNATQAGPFGMIRFLARRLLNYLVLLGLASFLTYCLTSITFHPLDSFVQRHPQPPAEAIHAKAVQLGLDQPIPIRYANWVSRAVAGDFGKTVTGHPVSQELWRRIESGTVLSAEG